MYSNNFADKVGVRPLYNITQFEAIEATLRQPMNVVRSLGMC